MKILLIGPQGSGKSTQAEILANQLGLPKITVGDIYRKLAQENSADSRRIKEVLGKGQLVDDVTTARIVKERLSQKDCQNGFVVDGYPRTLEQARLFDPQYNIVFYLKLDPETAMTRLLGRGRADDTKELIKNRLDLYYKQTEALINYYKDLGNLIEINARGSIEEVKVQINKHLNGKNE